MIDTPSRTVRCAPGGGTRVPEGAWFDAPRNLNQPVWDLFAAGEPKFRTGEDWNRLEKRPQPR
jgi:hypothetical protein